MSNRQYVKLSKEYCTLDESTGIWRYKLPDDFTYSRSLLLLGSRHGRFLFHHEILPNLGYFLGVGIILEFQPVGRIFDE